METSRTEGNNLSQEGLSESLCSLRSKLYCKAKREPKFRFYTLYGHLLRKDVLEGAWRRVKRGGPSPGIDGVTVGDLERTGGVEALLLGLEEDLRGRKYRASPVLRTYIPKEDGRLRPIGIPTVRDRVVQTACVLILEAIFEADFKDCSHGFRPKRSAHDALDQIKQNLQAGRKTVYDADVKGYFDNIPHDKLMASLEMRIADRKVLHLIRQWLKAPVKEKEDRKSGKGGGPLTRSKKGTPQGGVISPLLANVYLHWLDTVFSRAKGPGSWAKAKLVRYADDFVIMAHYVDSRLINWVKQTIEEWLGLELNEEKTRVLDLREEGACLDFLGYSFRYDRDLKGRAKRYLNISPSAKSLKREREKLRELTSSKVCFKPIPKLIGELNAHLKGWAAYYRYGYPRKGYREINWYVRQRLHAHLSRRSQRPWKPKGGRTEYEQYKKWGLVYL